MCRANGDGGTGRDAYGGVLAPGTTASNDGQFFSTTRQGEASNLVNARYGNEPALKGCTHVSKRFGPFTAQVVSAAVNGPPCTCTAC